MQNLVASENYVPFTSVFDTALAVWNSIVYKNSRTLAYETFTREKISSIPVALLSLIFFWSTLFCSGVGAYKDILQLFATVLVLLYLRETFPQQFSFDDSFHHTGVLEERWSSSLSMAMTFVRSMTTKYPSMYSRLDLGSSWGGAMQSLTGDLFCSF